MLIAGVPGDPRGALSLYILNDTMDGGRRDVFLSGDLSDRRSCCIFAVQLALLGRATQDVLPRTLYRHPDYL